MPRSHDTQVRGTVGNHTACRVGPQDISKMFGPVRAPCFHTCMVFLRFCAGSRPVDRLAGAVLAPTGQITYNQVLPGKCNTMVPSLASSGPVRPGATDHTDIPKPVYNTRTVPAYIIVFPSPYEPYGTLQGTHTVSCDPVVKEHAGNP